MLRGYLKTHTGPGDIGSQHTSGLDGMSVISAFRRRRRPEDHEFEANLGYV